MSLSIGATAKGPGSGPRFEPRGGHRSAGNTITRLLARRTPPLARWTTRLALFSLGLAGAAVFLHRLFNLPTPVALNLFQLAFLGAAAAILTGVIAAVHIWQGGGEGGARVVAGILLGGALFIWPAAYFTVMRDLPAINDITTDAVDPPPFEEIASRRGPGANSVKYPGQTFAALQTAAYADIKPLEIERSSTEAFELVADVVRNRLHMTIVREQPPKIDTGEAGYLEAIDRTLIVGFRDDVSIRVRGGEERSRIDLRSASRHGRHDLGQNADRLRRVLREFVVRLEETVPAAPANVTLKSREERAKTKQQREGRRTSPGRRKREDLDQ